MIILLITLLLVVSVVVVLYPALTRRADAEATEDTAQWLAESLRRARDRVYEELRVLQQEHFLRHLSDEEYQARLQAARVAAALLLRQQQQVQETVAALDLALEDEIRRAAQQSGSTP